MGDKEPIFGLIHYSDTWDCYVMGVILHSRDNVVSPLLNSLTPARLCTVSHRAKIHSYNDMSIVLVSTLNDILFYELVWDMH